jgi:hypothetical protein
MPAMALRTDPRTEPDHDMLTRLNRDYIASVQNSDVARFDRTDYRARRHGRRCAGLLAKRAHETACDRTSGGRVQALRQGCT